MTDRVGGGQAAYPGKAVGWLSSLLQEGPDAKTANKCSSLIFHSGVRQMPFRERAEAGKGVVALEGERGAAPCYLPSSLHGSSWTHPQGVWKCLTFYLGS